MPRVNDQVEEDTLHKVQLFWSTKAQTVFAEQLTICLQKVAVVGITTTPEVRIRTMQKRWGSCTTAGVITLNLKLIQVPKALIDYVIMHELYHLKEHKHSKAYYHLLEQVLPAWQAPCAELNK